MSARRKDVEGGNAIELSSVTPLWMEVTATERCAPRPGRLGSCLALAR